MDFKQVDLTTTSCVFLEVCLDIHQHVVHAPSSSQWLASGPGYFIRGRPCDCYTIWPWLGPYVYENGWSVVQHGRKGIRVSQYSTTELNVNTPDQLELYTPLACCICYVDLSLHPCFGNKCVLALVYQCFTCLISRVSSGEEFCCHLSCGHHRSARFQQDVRVIWSLHGHVLFQVSLQVV